MKSCHSQSHDSVEITEVFQSETKHIGCRIGKYELKVLDVLTLFQLFNWEKIFLQQKNSGRLNIRGWLQPNLILVSMVIAMIFFIFYLFGSIDILVEFMHFFIYLFIKSRRIEGLLINHYIIIGSACDHTQQKNK